MQAPPGNSPATAAASRRSVITGIPHRRPTASSRAPPVSTSTLTTRNNGANLGPHHAAERRGLAEMLSGQHVFVRANAYRAAFGRAIWHRSERAGAGRLPVGPAPRCFRPVVASLRRIRLLDPDGAGRDKGAALEEEFMDKQDAPQQASQEEEARIGETPAIFANKVYVSPLPGGAKITFAEACRASGEDRASPRVAVFLQHADLAALRRLLDWKTSAAETPPEHVGGSVH